VAKTCAAPCPVCRADRETRRMSIGNSLNSDSTRRPGLKTWTSNSIYGCALPLENQLKIGHFSNITGKTLAACLAGEAVRRLEEGVFLLFSTPASSPGR